ncbi:DNA cytosine methyltransferase [bacterium]|nr:DNA cytosine methyltransferase [bacterium]
MRVRKLNVVELFCGSGTISKEFKKAGHNVFSIDIRKRKGVCEPSLRKNIMHVTVNDIPFEKVDVIWASPPCDVFSKAGAGFHWNKDGSPKTQKCLEHICILRKTLKFIERLHPGYFFVENPDGKMKYRKELVNFLIRNNGKTLRLHYKDYGFGTLKPTTIFTNALDYFGKSSPDKSSEKCKVVFNNLTKCKKQAIPEELAREIREFCEDHLK